MRYCHRDTIYSEPSCMMCKLIIRYNFSANKKKYNFNHFCRNGVTHQVLVATIFIHYQRQNILPEVSFNIK